jgi:nicotinamidase/pyrazinamidase
MNALIFVDLQNDFLPGGALAVAEGDQVIPVANRLALEYELVIATQDWHPENHSSFSIWPPHCIQNTKGAQFSADLDANAIHYVFQKGTDPGIDSYSGFFDNDHKKSTGLGDFLKNKDVTAVTILGLATDYCVKFTALDARKLGFGVTVLKSGCRAVNLQPGDGEAAFEEMRRAGVTVAG